MPSRDLERAAARLTEGGEVLRVDDLADPGSEGVAHDDDIDPATQQHDTDVRPVQPQVLGQPEGQRLLDVRAEHHEQLGRVLLQPPNHLVHGVDHGHLAADGERERLGQLRLLLDQQRHGVPPVKRPLSPTPVPVVGAASAPSRAKVIVPVRSAWMIRAAWSAVTASVIRVEIETSLAASWTLLEFFALSVVPTVVAPTASTVTSGTSTRVARWKACESWMWSPAGVSGETEVESVDLWIWLNVSKIAMCAPTDRKVPTCEGSSRATEMAILPLGTASRPSAAATAPNRAWRTISPGCRELVATRCSMLLSTD